MNIYLLGCINHETTTESKGICFIQADSDSVTVRHNFTFLVLLLQGLLCILVLNLQLQYLFIGGLYILII